MATTMTRKIVEIDEAKCTGCGLCVPKCAEGAIRIVDGKARLRAENLCDGLGACLGECPEDAIRIIERPADAFDEVAVEKVRHEDVVAEASKAPPPKTPCGCPGSMARKLAAPAPATVEACCGGHDQPSRLGQWPIQLGLVPTRGEIWQDADVLIAADCVGHAMPDYHEALLAGKAVAIACPKLDDVDAHTRKLTEIFRNNPIRSITIAHMEVPCCFGIVQAVRQALRLAGRTDIPVHDVTVGIDGKIQR
ncbi:MAG: 4Fe-4S binding protein [Planctomycetota bacterium]